MPANLMLNYNFTLIRRENFNPKKCKITKNNGSWTACKNVW